jgi:hypothetical protein
MSGLRISNIIVRQMFQTHRSHQFQVQEGRLNTTIEPLHQRVRQALGSAQDVRVRVGFRQDPPFDTIPPACMNALVVRAASIRIIHARSHADEHIPGASSHERHRRPCV